VRVVCRLPNPLAPALWSGVPRADPGLPLAPMHCVGAESPTTHPSFGLVDFVGGRFPTPISSPPSGRGRQGRPWASSRSHALRGSGKPHNPSVFWAFGCSSATPTPLVPALWSGTPRADPVLPLAPMHCVGAESPTTHPSFGLQRFHRGCKI